MRGLDLFLFDRQERARRYFAPKQVLVVLEGHAARDFREICEQSGGGFKVAHHSGLIIPDSAANALGVAWMRIEEAGFFLGTLGVQARLDFGGHITRTLHNPT